eukprot:gene6049-5482_t
MASLRVGGAPLASLRGEEGAPQEGVEMLPVPDAPAAGGPEVQEVGPLAGGTSGKAAAVFARQGSAGDGFCVQPAPASIRDFARRTAEPAGRRAVRALEAMERSLL